MLDLKRLLNSFNTLFKIALKSYRSPVFLRVLVVWTISVFILIADVGLKNYDYRFKFRSRQAISNDIVLLTISRAEWDELFKPSFMKSMIYRQESVSDAYYWNTQFWLQVFYNLKKMGVDKIGMDFYFSRTMNVPWNIQQLLSNERSTFWISEVDNLGQLLPSKFSDNFNENIAVNLLRPDYDGILRNYYFSTTNIPQLPEILSKNWPNITWSQEDNLINFRGLPGTFESYPLMSVFDGSISKDLIKNKTVIIAPDYGKDHLIKTPLGLMNRAEVFATVLDNINENRWIKKWPLFVYAFLILPLIVLCVFIVLSFPQGIGITFLFSLSFITVSMSILLFDIYYIWTPLITSLSCIFLSYVIIISQMLFDRERNVWQMQKEKEYLKSLDELKTNFVSLISHDLKTPLAKIQSVINRVRSDQSLGASEQLSLELNSIYQESKHLDRYIKSILNLLKIESKDFTILKKPLDINDVIEKVCDQLKSVAEEKNVQFQLNLEPMFLIEADKILVHEILINIIENAIKYSNKDSYIFISSFEDDNNVNVKVQDHGPGIKKEHISLVFEKFYRGENSISSQGTGLGLFLVKYFVKLHNGTIHMDSVVGEGTTVTVSLPIEENQ